MFRRFLMVVPVSPPSQASPHAGPSESADPTGLRPLPPTPKEDLAVSNMRMARSDFSDEYLDEEFNPRQMMLNQDESCSRHLNQLPR